MCLQCVIHGQPCCLGLKLRKKMETIAKMVTNTKTVNLDW